MTEPRNPKHANKTQDLGNGYTIERRLMGYAYPRNGNVHNATPRYHWVLRLDGSMIASSNYRTPMVALARTDAGRVSA